MKDYVIINLKLERLLVRKYRMIIIVYLSSKILYAWNFILEGKEHKIEYWDSRLSGKKKLAIDGKITKFEKDLENFNYHFRLSGYNFHIIQKEDSKPQLKINDRNFNDILADERTGKWSKEKEEYLKKKEREKEKEKKKNKGNEDDYYKRALKYNGDNYFEGGEDEAYDIEEQRKRLEEFERKKKKEDEEKKKRNYNNNNDDDYYNDNNKKKDNFILDNTTANKNRIIINNIYDIFDDEMNNNNNINNNNINILDLNDNNQINNNYNQKIITEGIICKNPYLTIIMEIIIIIQTFI